MSIDEEKPSEFERRAGELLRDGADRLDAHTRSRLTQARFAAVEEARRRRGSRFVWRAWLPLGGMVAAALAVLLWSGGLQQGVVREPHGAMFTNAQTPLDDLDLIAADENLEMIEEVEFYAWLDSDAASAAVNGVG